MTRHAVVGVGAVGVAVAVALARGGLRPLLALRSARGPFCVQLGDGELIEEHLSTWLSPADADPVDVVWLATKAHQTSGAKSWLHKLTASGGRIVVLQNGVEHIERVRPLVAADVAIVPAVVDVPATRSAPATTRLRRTGKVLLPPGHEDLAHWLGTQPFLTVSTAADAASFHHAMWRKLCVNVISGAIPTLTNRPADVFRDASIQDVAKKLVDEAIAVATAEGVRLDSGLTDEIVANFAKADPAQLNSMLVDRRAGVPLEHDARNGAVVRIGRRHNIKTPYNELACALLSALGSTPGV